MLAPSRANAVVVSWTLEIVAGFHVGQDHASAFLFTRKAEADFFVDAPASHEVHQEVF